MYQETECKTSSAWNIGRAIKNAGGSLRRAEQSCDRRTQKQCNRTLYRRKFYRGSDLCSGKRPAAGSRRAEGRLERNRQRHHSGSDLADASVLIRPMPSVMTCPQAALSAEVSTTMFPDCAMAWRFAWDGSSAILVSDSKYGYRGQKESLNLTLINSSVSPDPYPERGIHTITLCWRSERRCEGSGRYRNRLQP